MIVVPCIEPDTIPLEEPIVATLKKPLVHVPPVVASVKVTVEPAHTVPGPDIAAGNGLTVITAVA
jgi:hypothetical protein